MRLTSPLVVLSIVLAGCAGPRGNRGESAGTPHTVGPAYGSRSGALVSVASSASMTRADVTITAGDVVLWHNDTTNRPVAIEVATAVPGGCEIAGACGFQVMGNSTVTEPVLVPGAVAGLAFPDPGTYAYTIRGLDAPVRGTVRVAALPPPAPEN